MQSKTAPKGFSLVELILVIGVIAILAQVVKVKFKIYRTKAFQTEAITNLRHIEILQENYRIDRGFFYKPSGGPGRHLITVGGDVTENCNISNPIGFKINNCLNSRYKYYLLTYANRQEYVGYAIERGGSPLPTSRAVFPGCTALEPDFWELNRIEGSIAPPENVSKTWVQDFCVAQ